LLCASIFMTGPEPEPEVLVSPRRRCRWLRSAVVAEGNVFGPPRFVQVGLEGPAMSVLQLLVRLEAAPLYWSAGMRERGTSTTVGGRQSPAAIRCRVHDVGGGRVGGSRTRGEQPALRIKGRPRTAFPGRCAYRTRRPPRTPAVNLLTVMLFLADMCEQAGPATAASCRPSRGSRRSGPTRRGQDGAPGPGGTKRTTTTSTTMTASADFQAHLAAEHAARDVVAVEGRFWVDIFFVS
jgi:hypothetical protein